ncbi:hypothetical protein ACH3VR_21430 [Microbacterium sp. B2969]|uniref:Uncharacterized protein n=1 Tax=Microbacterium alkaliflavum TaxID=3248839 RepID=A0ABW7QDG9_9MICO
MARQYIGDARIDQSVRAFAAITRGDFKRDRIDPARPDGEVWERNTPAAIADALARSRIGAAVIAEPCPLCSAVAGRYCYPSCGGMCGPRVRRAEAALATHRLTNLEMSR